MFGIKAKLRKRDIRKLGEIMAKTVNEQLTEARQKIEEKFASFGERLSSAIAEENGQVRQAIVGLKRQIEELQKQAAEGSISPEDLQAQIDGLDAIAARLQDADPKAMVDGIFTSVDDVNDPGQPDGEGDGRVPPDGGEGEDPNGATDDPELID